MEPLLESLMPVDSLSLSELVPDGKLRGFRSRSADAGAPRARRSGRRPAPRNETPSLPTLPPPSSSKMTGLPGPLPELR